MIRPALKEGAGIAVLQATVDRAVANYGFLHTQEIADFLVRFPDADAEVAGLIDRDSNWKAIKTHMDTWIVRDLMENARCG